jgi:hypothetical protein
MSRHIISITLIFDSTNNFLWTNTKVNNLGIKINDKFRKKLRNRAHIVDVKTHKTLCGGYQLDPTTRSRTVYRNQWASTMSALCLGTSVTVDGSASYYDATNVTFLRVCRECMRKAPSTVRLSLNFGIDKNNHWTSKTVVERANEFEIDNWKEYGLNV